MIKYPFLLHRWPLFDHSLGECLRLDANCKDSNTFFSNGFFRKSTNTFFLYAFFSSENEPHIGFYIIFIIQPGCCSSLIETLPKALSFLGQVCNSKYFYISTFKMFKMCTMCQPEGFSPETVTR